MKNADTKPRTVRERYQQTPARSSIGANFVALTLLSLLLLAALAYIIYLMYLAPNQVAAQRAATERANQTAQQYRAIVQNYIEHTIKQVNKMAGSVRLREALAGGGVYLKSQIETQWRDVLPDLHRIKLLNPGVGEPDPNANPPIGYACLALQQAAEQGKTPPADIHGKPLHIDVLRPVKDQNGKLIGHVFVTLKIDGLRQALRSVPTSGIVELKLHARKQFRTLISHGSVQRNPTIKSRHVPVPGTNWFIQTRYAPSTAGQGLFQYLDYMAIFGVAGLMLIVFLVLYNQRLNRQLAKDQRTIVHLVRDITEGDLAEQYPVHLKNFRGTISELVTIATDYINSNHSPTTVANKPEIRHPENAVAAGQQPSPAAAAEPGTTAQNKPDVSNEPEVALQDLDISIDALQVEEDMEEVTIPAEVFRAYDIRGLVTETFTPGLVYEIGRAIGSEAVDRGLQSIAVGRDGRLSGPDLRDAISRGLQDAGMQVVDIGMAPTPVLYYAAHVLTAGSGVMITGSHNPPDYNGIKMMLGGETIFGLDIQKLRERIESENYRSGTGSEKQVDVAGNYAAKITSDIKLKRPMKIVVDCGNGVAGAIAPKLFSTLGCEVIPLYCEVDGTFPNHHPDPSKPENVVEVMRAVKANKADIGFAFDGDGDRLGVIDSEGKVIWPDRTMMVLARDVISRNPGAQIIYDVKCTRKLADVIKQAGGVPLMWKTGHSFIKAKMKESGALLAGEMSGHIFFKERWFGFDDAIYTGARLLEILSADKRSSHQVFAELPDTVNTPELNIMMKEGETFEFIDQLIANADFDDGQLIGIDGLRVEFPDGWGLIRSSNTTPVLVLRFEADTQEALTRIQNQFRDQIHKIRPDLELPF